LYSLRESIAHGGPNRQERCNSTADNTDFCHQFTAPSHFSNVRVDVRLAHFDALKKFLTSYIDTLRHTAAPSAGTLTTASAVYFDISHASVTSTSPC